MKDEFTGEQCKFGFRESDEMRSHRKNHEKTSLLVNSANSGS